MKTDKRCFTAPVVLASELIKIKSVNGVNDESECILYAKSLLDEAGAETELIYKDARRPFYLFSHINYLVYCALRLL